MLIALNIFVYLGLPTLVTAMVFAGQKSDYKKEKKGKETYKEFCERNYTRYI